MRQMRDGYHGLSSLVGLHADRLWATSAIAGAVLLAAWVQSF